MPQPVETSSSLVESLLTVRRGKQAGREGGREKGREGEREGEEEGISKYGGPGGQSMFHTHITTFQ